MAPEMREFLEHTHGVLYRGMDRHLYQQESQLVVRLTPSRGQHCVRLYSEFAQATKYAVFSSVFLSIYSDCFFLQRMTLSQ